jgi:heme exporter protein CcmD
MGGYAVYVWPAYIVSAIVLVTATVVTLKAHARAKKAVQRLEEESREGEGEER